MGHPNVCYTLHSTKQKNLSGFGQVLLEEQGSKSVSSIVCLHVRKYLTIAVTTIVDVRSASFLHGEHDHGGCNLSEDLGPERFFEQSAPAPDSTRANADR